MRRRGRFWRGLGRVILFTGRAGVAVGAAGHRKGKGAAEVSGVAWFFIALMVLGPLFARWFVPGPLGIVAALAYLGAGALVGLWVYRYMVGR